jgi:hypothetical protein
MRIRDDIEQEDIRIKKEIILTSSLMLVSLLVSVIVIVIVIVVVVEYIQDKTIFLLVV